MATNLLGQSVFRYEPQTGLCGALQIAQQNYTKAVSDYEALYVQKTGEEVFRGRRRKEVNAAIRIQALARGLAVRSSLFRSRFAEAKEVGVMVSMPGTVQGRLVHYFGDYSH